MSGRLPSDSGGAAGHGADVVLERVPAGSRRWRGVVVTVAFTTAIYGFIQFSVIPLLPVIQEDMDVGPTWGTWIFTVFPLISIVASPLLGNLGDQFGKRRLLLLVTASFTVGSIGVALAPTIGFVLVFRCLQGTLGAVFGLGFAAVRDAVPRERVASAIAVISSGTTTGGVIALMTAGPIADALSWRWLFGLATVAGVAGFVLVHRYIVPTAPSGGAKLDVPGAVLLAVTLTLFLVGVTEGNDLGWTSAIILSLFAASLVMGAIWCVTELKAVAPVVDVRKLARRTVLLTNAVSFLGPGLGATGLLILLPRYAAGPGSSVEESAQYGFGASVTETTLMLVPYSLAGIATGLLAGVITRRFGPVAPLLTSMSIGVAGTVSLALWHATFWQATLFMGVSGAATTLTNGASANIIVRAARHTETAALSAMTLVIRQIGSAVGAQTLAAVLAAHVIAGTTIPSADAFAIGIWFCAGAMAAGLGASLILARVIDLPD